MLKTLLARAQQKHRTIGFPKEPPVLPDRLRGRPEIDAAKCPPGCRMCADACPTDAITSMEKAPGSIWAAACFVPNASAPVRKARSASPRNIASPLRAGKTLVLGEKEFQLAKALDEKARRIFGRSLKLRQVSAGGCNGCESDVNVLNTVVFDLGRFGIQFVASPRHADGLLITGPVTQNMELALRKTYEAVPSPKLVIAVGACAISGGPYIGHAEQRNGADEHRAGGPLHSRLSAASHHDSGRTAENVGTNRIDLFWHTILTPGGLLTDAVGMVGMDGKTRPRKK